MCNHKMYSFAIYDDDIGGIICEKNSLSYSELLNEVENHLIYYSAEDEVIQDEKFQNDMKEWDANSILDTLERVDFFGGLLEVNIWYPGHHRQIQIRLKDTDKEKKDGM